MTSPTVDTSYNKVTFTHMSHLAHYRCYLRIVANDVKFTHRTRVELGLHAATVLV